VNRIDEIVVFHALDEATSRRFARVQLKELERRVRAIWEMDIRSPSRGGRAAKAGFDPVYGARTIKRAIQQPDRESAVES